MLKGNQKRRRYVRLNMHCLLKYKTIGNKQVLSSIRNLSAGGALFYCREKIAAGSVIELSLNFPMHNELIKIVAKTVRIKPLKKIEGFFVAVEFINIDDKVKQLINDKILYIYKAKGSNG